MMNSGALGLVSTLGAACLVVACSASPGDDPASASGDPVGSFTVTEVHIGAQGKDDVKVHSMTVDEFTSQMREVISVQAGDAQARDYAAHRVTCSPDSVYLFDNSLAQCAAHGCNEICFDHDYTVAVGEANVYLGNYCVTGACSYSWNSVVRSYWTGRNTGSYYLWRNYLGWPTCYEMLGGAYSYKDAGVCGQGSDYLVFANF